MALIFDFPFNLKATSPSDSLDEARKYVNASITQFFYSANIVHDLYYRYSLLFILYSQLFDRSLVT